MKQYVVLILLFCQSCAFFSQTATRQIPQIESLMEQKDEKKQLPVIQIEHLMKQRDWQEAQKILDEWDFKNSKRKRELKYQIDLVRGFWKAYDGCVEQENVSSVSLLYCYRKVILHNWKNMPKQIYFSRAFAADLNAQKDTVLAKIKKLKRKRKRKHKPRKQTNAQEFFDAYYSCLRMERTSPESFNKILICYKGAYGIKESIPRRTTYSQEVSADLYTKTRKIIEKIVQLKTKLAEGEKEEKKEKDLESDKAEDKTNKLNKETQV